jgi:hypothetical protein
VSDKILCRLIRDEEIEAVSQLTCEVFTEFIAPLFSSDGQQEFLRYASPNAIRERQRFGHVTFVAKMDE